MFVAQVLYASGYWGARKGGSAILFQMVQERLSEDLSRDPHPGPEKWRSRVGPEEPHSLSQTSALGVELSFLLQAPSWTQPSSLTTPKPFPSAVPGPCYSEGPT